MLFGLTTFQPSHEYFVRWRSQVLGRNIGNCVEETASGRPMQDNNLLNGLEDRPVVKGCVEDM